MTDARSRRTTAGRAHKTAARRKAPAPRLPIALTGTPGVGKTAVAAALSPRWRSVEVSELALRLRAGRRTSAGVLVDLSRLRAALRHDRAYPGSVDVVVGHLSHLLPVRGAIVLRCHPLALRRRLDRARRGTARDRAANVVAEALDLVLVEALREGQKVFEIDTTGQHVAEVAVEVDRRLRRGPRSRTGQVDWLSDPAVTEHLLDGAG